MAFRWVAQRPRTSLMWALVGFAGLQIGLAVAVERRLQDVRDPEYADKFERLQKCIAQSPGRPLVVMLGSSRAFEGFEAGCLNGSPDISGGVAFNLGLTGGCSFLELVSLKRLLVAGIRP